MQSFLADTQILLWSMREPRRLPASTQKALSDPEVDAAFSVVSIWEIAIKANLGRAEFSVDAREARSVLLRDGWRELGFGGEHALLAGALPLHHADPFDRALVAQARVEKIELLTSDRRLKAYGPNVRYFRPTGASRS